MKLIIGNKNYSSWSLRAWLFLSANDIPFQEIRIPLDMPDTASELSKYSGAVRVPVLHDNELVVWDSLAICEYISEQYLAGKGWPADAKARAVARACCAEMHSSFFALREVMPMNCRAQDRKVSISEGLNRDIHRIDTMWSELREKYAAFGPWLFGDFCIADCMYAPVVMRFSTYDVAVSEPSKSYMNHVRAHPKIRRWLQQASTEIETIESEEVGV